MEKFEARLLARDPERRGVRRARTCTVSITLMAVLVLTMANPPVAQVGRQIGFIPNELVDTIVDLPMRDAEDIFDLYQVIIDVLQEVYLEGGDAAGALADMESLLQQHQNSRRQGDAARTVEMPIPIDAFMRTLRDEAPGRSGTSLDPDKLKAQLYAGVFLPFLQCRGITYRLRPMIEDSFFMHTAAIGMLRALKQRLDVSAGPNGLAAFEFLTYPMAHKGDAPVQFDSPGDVQRWLEGHLIPTLGASITMVEQVRQQWPQDHRESLNLSLFLETDESYPDPEVRAAYRYFTVAEIDHLISKLYRWRATLRLACAYNLDDFPAATNELRQLISKSYFGELTSSQPPQRIGTTSRMRFEVYERYPALFTLRNAEHCRLALTDFQQSWTAFDRAMRAYFDSQPSTRNDRLVNLRWVQATYDEYTKKIAPEMVAVLNGRASLQDYIGGRVLDMDLAGALMDPPADLKDFFPSRFNEGSPYRELEFTSGALRYSNYDYGNSVGWKLDAAERSWLKLFPNLSREQTAEGNWNAPLLAHRDLSRTYIGNVMAPLLWTVIH